jgi:hypothetical protein
VISKTFLTRVVVPSWASATMAPRMIDSREVKHRTKKLSLWIVWLLIMVCCRDSKVAMVATSRTSRHDASLSTAACIGVQACALYRDEHRLCLCARCDSYALNGAFDGDARVCTLVKSCATRFLDRVTKLRLNHLHSLVRHTSRWS